MIPNDMPRHNHLTRDIKPEGECPMCDRHHQRRRANNLAAGIPRDGENGSPDDDDEGLAGLY